MKRKQVIIEWVIVLSIMLIILPIINVKTSSDKEEMFNFFKYQIRIINPILIIALIIRQVWRIKKAKGLSNKEILRSFIPFRRTKINA